jgi:response regulator RpfG family c-di-GMP phosphodiesterase
MSLFAPSNEQEKSDKGPQSHSNQGEFSMSTAATAEAEKPAAAAKAKPPAPAAAKLFVLDTTAIEGKRIHEQLVNGHVKQFTFEPYKGTELDAAVAAKFLQHEAFKRVDEAGNEIEYQRPPRQPEQLQAGETLKLAGNETVARFDELTNTSLLKRACALPGGEKFIDTKDRPGLIKFIIDAKAKLAAANKAAPEVSKDEFVPEADYDEEAA